MLKVSFCFQNGLRDLDGLTSEINVFDLSKASLINTLSSFQLLHVLAYLQLFETEVSEILS